MTTVSQNILAPLLEDWRQLLTQWSRSGALGRAARDALRLEEEPERLRELLASWSAGDFGDLPPIKLLPAGAMPGAAGAYAISTGTIYLNADWLPTASPQQALAVLTEELGHHLDAALNRQDTPGDEGELFAALLLGAGQIPAQERLALRAEDVGGRVWVAGQQVSVEQAATVVSSSIAVSRPGATNHEVRNRGAFAALKTDGSVVTWGNNEYGGDSSAVAVSLRSGVRQIFSSEYAFAALKADGSVITWGAPNRGGNSNSVAARLRSGVRQIFSTYNSFAAIKDDGSVVTWGSSYSGGYSSYVAPKLSSGVHQIFSTYFAFAALKDDGSVVTWGSLEDGDSSAVAASLRSGVR